VILNVNLKDRGMKKIAVLAFGIYLFAGETVQAQTLESKYGLDSAKTVLNASLYGELWKQKNYEEALPYWRYVFMNAPAFQQLTYVRGEDIIAYMLGKTKKKEYLDTLMMLYDQRIQYFKGKPKFREGDVLGRKGNALVRYGDGSPATLKEAYGYLMKSFELEGERSHPVTLKTLFRTAADLAEKSELSQEEFVNLYFQLTDFTDKRVAEDGRFKEHFAGCRSFLDGIFFDSGMAGCDVLADVFTKKLDANKGDLAILKEISSLLKRMECTDLEIFARVAEEIYKQEPTAEAANSLAVMFVSKKEFDKAEQYFKEAIDKSEDAEIKVNSYLRLTHMALAKKNFQLAKKYAMEILKLNPNNGNAYIYLGQAYAYGAQSYGEEDFDKRTVYWVAVDKFTKAKQVDPSLTEKVNELIKTFSAHFPTKEDAFFRSITSGSTVKIGGWINESTTARFRE